MLSYIMITAITIRLDIQATPSYMYLHACNTHKPSHPIMMPQKAVCTTK